MTDTDKPSLGERVREVIDITYQVNGVIIDYPIPSKELGHTDVTKIRDVINGLLTANADLERRVGELKIEIRELQRNLEYTRRTAG